MESPYDSDMSDDTRELVEQGLAISHRNHSSRAERLSNDRGLAPTRNTDTFNVGYPVTLSASAGTTSTHRPAPVACESVAGAGRKIGTNQVGFVLRNQGAAEERHPGGLT